MGQLTKEVFNPSCCDGGAASANSMSAAPCGCDPGCGEGGYLCERHRDWGVGVPDLSPQASTSFTIKDSGKRIVFDSGMQRDVTEGKIDYSLCLDGPMFTRWAEHLTKGAVKYDARNWMKARGQAELNRFRESAFRHFIQWMNGDTDEDHAAAVMFGLNGAEYVKGLLNGA